MLYYRLTVLILLANEEKYLLLNFEKYYKFLLCNGIQSSCRREIELFLFGLTPGGSYHSTGADVYLDCLSFVILFSLSYSPSSFRHFFQARTSIEDSQLFFFTNFKRMEKRKKKESFVIGSIIVLELEGKLSFLDLIRFGGGGSDQYINVAGSCVPRPFSSTSTLL